MKFNENLIEKEVERNIVFSGKIFEVAQCQAELCNGDVVGRDIILHSGGVGILPIDEHKNVLLVQQYRYGASCFMLEIPAGKLELGEAPYSCAIRELSEETGCAADNMIKLGVLNPSPAILSEIIHIYLATGLHFGERHLDGDEFLDVVSVPFDEAVSMVMSGEITDAKTQIAILKAKELL